MLQVPDAATEFDPAGAELPNIVDVVMQIGQPTPLPRVSLRTSKPSSRPPRPTRKTPARKTPAAPTPRILSLRVLVSPHWFDALPPEPQKSGSISALAPAATPNAASLPSRPRRSSGGCRAFPGTLPSGAFPWIGATATSPPCPPASAENTRNRRGRRSPFWPRIFWP
jgi:hypothetical protein